MDEGKATQDFFSASDFDEDDAPMTGFRFAGRLGSGVQSNIDLPVNLPDEDEAVSHVAQRFRRAKAFSILSMEVPSLDNQPLESDSLSARDLEGALINALDSPAHHDLSDYVLEEVADEAAPLDPNHPRAKERQTLRQRERSSGKNHNESTLTCPHCGAHNPHGMRFCVQCGGSLQGIKSGPSSHVSNQTREPPPPSEASRKANPWAMFLVSINEDGSDGVGIPLEFLETTVGRDGDTRFPTDAFLSPKHARLHIEKGDLLIEDLYSLNGTFLKLRDEVKLTPGDTFLMGRQVLRFERFEQSISPKTKSLDGTRYMGSPAPGGNFKLLQVGIGGIVQNVYCLPNSGAVLGREKGDIIFPHDKFMSSRHAQIYTGDDGNCYLVDLTSSNGTWIKIWEKTGLRHNDYIFMGQQLFRVHIKDHKR